MSDRASTRGLYYFDIVAALLLGMVVAGRLATHDSAVVPPPATDVAGVWAPLLAVAIIAVFRRRAYTQTTPWLVTAFTGLAGVAIAVLFWRWHLVAFVTAIVGASLLAATGLVLRARRLAEPLARVDQFALILVVGGLGLGVVLIEGVLRAAPGLFNPEIQRMLRADPRNYGVAHPYIGHLHKPDNAIVLSARDFHAVHHVDGLGFRNPWPWPDQAEIVVIGDSVTFGYGVPDDQAWPHLLRTAAAPNRVVNLGLIGAGPQQYFRLFETFGARLRPKLVLVGLFPQNDFWDADAFDRWQKSEAGGNFMVWRDFGRPRPVRFSVRDPVDSFARLANATIYPALRSTYLYTLLRALRGGVEGAAPAPARIYEFADGSRVQLRVSEYLSMSALAQPDRREFRLLLAALRQIHELAAQQGAHALMVLQPGKEQVYLPLLGETRGDPTVALRAALDRLNIEYLDLAPGFRARAAGERLFFEVDGHPNQAGYALTAALVQAHLKAHAARYGLVADSAHP